MANEIQPGIAVFRAVSEMQEVFDDFKKMRDEAAKTEDAVKSSFGQGIQDSLNAASDKLKDVGSSMQGAGAKMTAGITLPLVGLGKVALDTFTEFDTKMTKTELVMSATAEQANQLRDRAVQLGASFGSFSATDAAESMYELSSAGLNFDQVMAAIEPTLQFAEAAVLGLGEASGIVAETMNAFGLEATETQRVGDVLTRMLQVSTFHADELGEAMAHAGQLGATANQDLESVAAALATIRSQGVPAAQAGTAVRQMLDNLKAPTDKARGVMETLGVEIRDASGQMLQFPDIIRNFQDSLDPASEGMQKLGEKTGLAGQALIDYVQGAIFGVQGNKAFALAMNTTFDVMNDGAEGTALLAAVMGEDYVAALEAGETVTLNSADALDALTAEMHDSEGTAAGFADRIQQTLQSTLANLGGAFESVAIALVTILEPALNDFVRDTVIPAVEAITQWIQANPELVTQLAAIAGIAAAAGPALVILGTALRGFGGVLGFLAGGFGILRTAIGLLFSPLTLLVGLFAAAVATSPELQEKLLALGERVLPALVAIFEAFLPLAEALVPVFETVAEALVVFLEAAAPVIEAVSEWVQENPELATTLFTLAVGLFLAGKAIRTFLGPLLLIRAAVMILNPLLIASGINIAGLAGKSKAASAALNILGFKGGFLKQAFSKLIGVIAAVGRAFIAFIVANPVLLAIAAIATAVFLIIKYWEPIKEFFGNLWEVVKEQFARAQEFMAGIGDAIGGVVDRMQQAVANAWETIKTTVGNAIQSALDFVKANWPLLIGIVLGPIGIIAGLIYSNWETIKSTIANAIEAVKSTISNGFTAAKNTITNIWNSIKSFIQSGVDRVKAIFQGLIDKVLSIPNAFKNMKDRVLGFFGDMGDKIASGAGWIREQLGKINPLQRFSPSLVEQVEKGVTQIRREYDKLSDDQVQRPNLVITSQFEDGSQRLSQSMFLDGLNESLLPIQVTLEDSGLSQTMQGLQSSISSGLGSVSSGLGGVQSSVDAHGQTQEGLLNEMTNLMRQQSAVQASLDTGGTLDNVTTTVADRAEQQIKAAGAGITAADLSADERLKARTIDPDKAALDELLQKGAFLPILEKVPAPRSPDAIFSDPVTQRSKETTINVYYPKEESITDGTQKALAFARLEAEIQ